MPVEHEAPAGEHKGTLPPAFKARLGPLPLYAWGIILAGGVLGFVILRRRGAGAASLSGGTLPPATIGSGAGGSDASSPAPTSPAPSPAPITTAPVSPITPMPLPFALVPGQSPVAPPPNPPGVAGPAHWETYPGGGGQWVWTPPVRSSWAIAPTNAFPAVGTTPTNAVLANRDAGPLQNYGE